MLLPSILFIVAFHKNIITSGLQIDSTPDILPFIQLATMRTLPDSSFVQENSCKLFAAEVKANTSLQMPFIAAGIPNLAVEAMRKWPDNENLQVACHILLTQIAAWNEKAQLALGGTGALQVSVDAIKKFGVKYPDVLVGQSGYYKDFCVPNRYKVDKLGGTEAVWKLVNEHYNGEMERNAQCFFSNACSPDDLSAKLAKLGYITHSLKAMRDFREEPGVRGEIIAIMSLCFTTDKNYLKTYVDGGMIHELIAAMHDEGLGVVELDVAGSARLYPYAMNLLKQLALTDPTWHDEIIHAGGPHQIVDTVLNHGNGNIRLNTIGLGDDLLTPACSALATLAKGNGTVHRDAVRKVLQQSGASEKFREMVSMSSTPTAKSACAQLWSTLKLNGNFKGFHEIEGR